MKILPTSYKIKLKKITNFYGIKSYILYRYMLIRNNFLWKHRHVDDNALFSKRTLRWAKIEVSKECPSRCKTCNFWKTKTLLNGGKITTEKLSLKDLKILGRDLKNLNCGNVQLLGGEPLLYPDIVELVSCFKKMNIFVEITTNGLLMTEKIAKGLVNAGLDSLAFSLDGPTKELNDYIRGVNGAYEKLINAIRLIQSADKNNKIMKNIGTTVSSLNIDHVDKILDVAHNLGINHVTFGSVTSYDSKTKEEADKIFNKKTGSVEFMTPNLMVKDKQLIERKRNELKEKAKKLGISVDGAFLDLTPEIIISGKLRPHTFCNGLLYHCVIDIYGNVYPCDFLRYILGNLHEKSLKEILTNNFRDFWKIYRNKWKSLEICDYCCYGV